MFTFILSDRKSSFQPKVEEIMIKRPSTNERRIIMSRDYSQNFSTKRGFSVTREITWLDENQFARNFLRKNRTCDQFSSYGENSKSVITFIEKKALRIQHNNNAFN